MNKKHLGFIAGLIFIVIIVFLIIIIIPKKSDDFKNKTNKKTPNQLHCISNDKSDDQGFKLVTEYFVDYNSKTNEVTKSKISNKIVSDVEELTLYFKNNTLDNYRSMNERYGGITTSSKSDDKSMTVTAVIDYTKIDFETYLKDYPALKAYVNENNKLSYEGLKSLYQAEKANCETTFK